MNFAFYGQAITADRPAARRIHARQLADVTARVHRYGGRIVADYFDIYRDRLTPICGIDGRDASCCKRSKTGNEVSPPW